MAAAGKGGGQRRGSVKGGAGKGGGRQRPAASEVGPAPPIVGGTSLLDASPDIECASSDPNYPSLFVASLVAIVGYGCVVPLAFAHKLRSAAGHRVDLGGWRAAAYLALVAGLGVALHFASGAFHHPLRCDDAPAYPRLHEVDLYPSSSTDLGEIQLRSCTGTL